jgi:glycosyltransferase involved in cell wall biosynthesis
MKGLDFSVLLSVYEKERENYLKLALNSIWNNQTLQPNEIVIVKDGPLREELEAVLSDFSRIAPVKFVVNEHNMGLAVSLNRGILACTYDIIARMDSDDISLPERFEKQIAFLSEYKNIDCLGTWAIEIDSYGNDYFKKQMPITHTECLKLFEKRDCFIHPTVMFRRSFFEKAGIYPTDTYFGEDTMMWANGFKSGCVFANLPEYLFQFRLNDDFFNRRRGWKHAKSIFQLRMKVNKMLEFGFKANLYAFLYALAKLMPKSILNLIYKKAR